MTTGIGTRLDTDSLEQALRRAWARTDELFACVRDEGWLLRPIPFRHPPIFYLGHLPAFAWNHIGSGVLELDPIDQEFEALFERGIDPLSQAAADDAAHAAWPEIATIEAYRDRVREAVIDSLPSLEARADDDVLAEHGRVVHVVLEHELMHHETLIYILHRMPLQHLRRPAAVPGLVLDATAPEVRRLEIPAGTATLGAPFDEVPFGWDNEFPETPVEVPAFGLDSVPVSIERYAAFVEAGGYADRSLWTEDAWAWMQQDDIRAPIGWRHDGTQWLLRTMFEEIPLEAAYAWPVYTSHVEALAFARWSGARLPTEPELHRAAYGTVSGTERPYPWGAAAPVEVDGNFDFRNWAPVPIGSAAESRSDFGAEELVGNGWEWTDTRFGPFPGFSAWARTYPGYSTDFFDERHFVVFGASWATDRVLLRRSFRNWYQDRYPFLFSTFRLAHPAR